jgi:hypothetical protein
MATKTVREGWVHLSAFAACSFTLQGEEYYTLYNIQ